eukprot:4480431-Prymnesium_polylepis.1
MEADPTRGEGEGRGRGESGRKPPRLHPLLVLSSGGGDSTLRASTPRLPRAASAFCVRSLRASSAVACTHTAPGSPLSPAG